MCALQIAKTEANEAHFGGNAKEIFTGGGNSIHPGAGMDSAGHSVNFGVDEGQPLVRAYASGRRNATTMCHRRCPTAWKPLPGGGRGADGNPAAGLPFALARATAWRAKRPPGGGDRTGPRRPRGPSSRLHGVDNSGKRAAGDVVPG